MRYLCCDDDRRRNAILEINRRPGATVLNGIDFLEVDDNPSQSPTQRQRTLWVHFIADPTGLPLSAVNVKIEGGDRIQNLQVTAAQIANDPQGGTDNVLVVNLDQAGDFSIYTLRLVPDPAKPESLDAIDPVLRAVDFSFKVNCETNFDYLQARECPPPPRTEPAIDYLAKDYLSFRQLMLDRLAVLLPTWQERNPADLGIALVELLAYVGDYLSYRQDAIATEAYLETCRLRTSARRHARLVDYFMHDGCNARTWVQVVLKPSPPSGPPSPAVCLLQDTPLFTALPDLPQRIPPGSLAQQRAIGAGAVVFETLHNADLYADHNEFRFYTWGSRECCLPQGATKATLRDWFPNLKPEMILIFQEVISPRTGDADDAELTHRHAVRLTKVTRGRDPIGKSFDQPPTPGPLEVTEIEWSADDRLPFPLCISAELDDRYGGGYVENVTVALGNIVLADHGRTLFDNNNEDTWENLGAVPVASLEQIYEGPPVRQTSEDVATARDRCRPNRTETIPPRYHPTLKEHSLTQAVPYNHPPDSARLVSIYHPRDAHPQIWLRGDGDSWSAQLDLLNSTANQPDFVVEVESDGTASLRFGDDLHGKRPSSRATFRANYRVGNGTQGNIGADALAHIVSNDDAIERVTNPLPAWGGADMETIEEVRQYAPSAFYPQDQAGDPLRPVGATLKRAVTPSDYGAIGGTHPEVQQAAASFRWTGSWHTVFVSVDRRDGLPVNTQFEQRLLPFLEPYRLAGHDLEIDRPRPVALEITLRIRVQPDYFRNDVKQALQKVFNRHRQPNGQLGLFHPDRFTFGQTVYLSPLYAAAQALDGVEWVRAERFQRRDQPGATGIDLGWLTFNRLEIARLDNDLNFPDRGVFELIMEGGK